MLKLLTTVIFSGREIVATNDKLFLQMFIKTEVFKWRMNIVGEDKLIVPAPVL
jgi:hypothetical protein